MVIKSVNFPFISLSSVDFVVQEQLREKEQIIHDLEKKMEEKDRELLAIKRDNEAVGQDHSPIIFLHFLHNYIRLFSFSFMNMAGLGQGRSVERTKQGISNI